MIIFLDDERDPSFVGLKAEDCVVCRDWFSFCRTFSFAKEKVSYISFDHDLGSGRDGYDCVKELCMADSYSIESGKGSILSDDFDFYVHSMNPVGAENIRAYMKNYLEHRND